MFRRAGLGLVLAILFSVVGVSGATASTTTTLKTVHYGGDSFRNFDFDSRKASAGNVDWPIDLVFWGNASVDKVYAGIGWSLAGSNEFGRLRDDGGAIWVPSTGATVAARAAAAWGAANVQSNATLMPDGSTSTFVLFGNAQSEQQGSHFFDNNSLPMLVHVP